VNTVLLKLLTVIAEAYLESQLLEEIKALGARGYSVSEVRGEGSRGVRASEWEGRNIKIETLVSAEVADLILQHVAAHYFPNYAVVAYVADVRGVRGDKYA
jgi:nitrogen regulatory protein P-II 2